MGAMSLFVGGGGESLGYESDEDFFVSSRVKFLKHLDRIFFSFFSFYQSRS